MREYHDFLDEAIADTATEHEALRWRVQWLSATGGDVVVATPGEAVTVVVCARCGSSLTFAGLPWCPASVAVRVDRFTTDHPAACGGWF